MAATRLQTTLGDRTKALCANIVVFYVSLYFASGHLSPTSGLESVWFLSGLALWFLALLSAPWFVPPKDALANALTAMAILVTLDLSSVGNLKLHLGVVSERSSVSIRTSEASRELETSFTKTI